MGDENINHELRLKNIEEIKNYFIKEINQNELMSKKHEKVCTILNHNEHFLILAPAITGCVSVSAFASLVGIPVRIISSAVELKICAITAAIENYKLMIPVHLQKCQKKVLKIHLPLTTVLLQRGLMIMKYQKQNLMGTV